MNIIPSMFHQYDDTLITVPPVTADVDGKLGGAAAHSELCGCLSGRHTVTKIHSRLHVFYI